ncbi:aspartate aminotransferase superfamily protein [Trifolium repens]|nr:aspartate aminotransferase superfamily protein [Trifolium repens]
MPFSATTGGKGSLIMEATSKSSGNTATAPLMLKLSPTTSTLPTILLSRGIPDKNWITKSRVNHKMEIFFKHKNGHKHRIKIQFPFNK